MNSQQKRPTLKLSISPEVAQARVRERVGTFVAAKTPRRGKSKAPPAPAPGSLTPHQQMMHRVEKRKRTMAIIEVAYPALFDEDNIRPMAIGIDKKLRAALSLTHSEAGSVMAWWVRRQRYLDALTQPGAQRYSLEGEAVGSVTEDQQTVARAVLQERKR